MSHIPLILASLLLLALALISAAVSALETALYSLKEHHVAVIDQEEGKLAGMMRAIARHPQRSLHQILMLGSVFNLVLAIAGLLFLREFDPFFSGQPFLAALILFGSLVFVSELIPSLTALVAPAPVFNRLIVPFIRISPALESLSAGLDGVIDRIGKNLTPKAFSPRRNPTDEEIETLIEMQREKGVLAASESEIIQEIIRLGNKTAKDCLVPRVDTFMISDALDGAEVLDKLKTRNQWFWRLPVYHESPDVIVGVLDVKAWLYANGEDLANFVRPPVFIPETMNALEAFRDYLFRPRSLCVVLDEYGGVEGILTNGGLVEEILWDAAPGYEQIPEIETLGEGHYRADGDARLDEISEVIGINVEHEGLDTIGGLVFNEVGHVPLPGSVVPFIGFRVKVRQCLRQRITGVEIKLGAEDSLSIENSRDGTPG